MNDNSSSSTTENEEAASQGNEEHSKAVTEANYDPFAARTLTHPTSDAAVFMHLLKASIGSGILFLPHAFSKAGYANALICSIIVGLISCHTAVILVQCTQVLCRRTQKSTMSFSETANVSLQFGPKCIRKYSDKLSFTVNLLVCFVQYETSVVYALYIATSSQQIIEHFTEINHNIRIYIALLLPILCALSLIPNFKYLVPFSIIGTFFLITGITGSMYYFIDNFNDPRRLNLYNELQSIPVYSSFFLFAIYNMSMILPLENTMKNPKNMKIIMTICMIISTIIYMIFGLLGHNKYENSCSTVIKNLPLNQTLAQIVKITVTLSVLCTCGLQYYIPVTILWPMIVKKIGRNHQFYEIIFRLAGVIITSLLAIAVPQMAPLLGLFTAFSMATVMLLIPVIIETSTMWNYEKNQFYFVVRITKNLFIGVIWLLILVFGVSENLKEIIKTYGKEEDADSPC